jgi:hypothetical protein
VRVGGVNLQAAWEAGRNAANNLLHKWYPLEGAEIDASIFQTRERDFLHPIKDYVGVRAQADDDRSERTEASEDRENSDDIDSEVTDSTSSGKLLYSTEKFYSYYA